MLHQIFLASGSEGSFGSICNNHLTIDYFVDKNPLTHMRVYLAVRVTSSTMCCLIDWHADKCGGKEEYSPFCEIFSSLDRLIDICNATQMNHGVVKG
eukprot:13395716-Ditylum_brightwellii.AAC.1